MWGFGLRFFGWLRGFSGLRGKQTAMANLGEIYITAQAKDGQSESLSLAEVDRKTFDSWARTQLGVVCQDFSRAPQWTPEERSPARLPGMHGFAAEDPDMAGAFVVWGRGVTPGEPWGEVSILDIYPTICSLLGIEPVTGHDGQDQSAP